MNREKLSKLKKIAEKAALIIRFFNFPIAKIAGINKQFEKAIMRPVIDSYSKNSKLSYIRYTTLPKKIDEIRPYSESVFSEFAIVIQGPILYNDDFTLNSINLYKTLFPDVKIIVSTWVGVKKEFKIFCDQSNVFLIENDEPKISGFLNINYQLISSKSGVIKALDIGCKYCVKTRSNQRIYARDSLIYLKNQLRLFPSGIRTKGRIIFTSYGMSYSSRPFCLCDSFSAGYTEDILNLYSVNLDNRDNEDYRSIQNKLNCYALTFREKMEPYSNPDPYKYISSINKLYNEYMCPEEYIAFYYCSNYCININEFDNLQKKYNEFLKNYAIIIDDSQIQLYWPKYIEYSTQDLNEYDFYGKLDYKKWLDIYLNYNER